MILYQICTGLKGILEAHGGFKFNEEHGQPNISIEILNQRVVNNVVMISAVVPRSLTHALTGSIR